MSQPSYSVFFNLFDLNTIPGVRIFNYETIDMPNRELKSNKLAREDKSILTSAEYSDKEIRIIGRLCGTDNDDAEDVFATLKGKIQQPNKQLQVSQANLDVEWTATLAGITSTWFGPWLNFTLIFKATDPIGADVAPTSLVSAAAVTTANADYDITVLGSFKAQPIITYTLNSFTGGVGKFVKFSNAETGEGIVVTRTWTAGDILVIDSGAKTVVVNSEVVDFTGTFPTFLPGERVLSYFDDLTTRNYDLSVAYNKKFA